MGRLDRCYVVAEIGINHSGSFDKAVEMIHVAAHYCKVSAVKFQKRTIHEMFTKEELAKPYVKPHSFGKTYGEHREALEFSIDQHAELLAKAKLAKVDYGCSVWDMTSAREIVGIQPDFVKIPSAANLNFEILKYLMADYSGPIHLSLGMTTRTEKEKIAAAIEPQKDRFVVYHCVSAYPVAFEDIYLGNLLDYEDFIHVRGFSGHHLGIAVDIAAFAAGCEYFERHFTLDRTSKGTDHAASLEPEGMRKLVRDLDAVNKAMRRNGADFVEVETEAKKKLQRVK